MDQGSELFTAMRRLGKKKSGGWIINGEAHNHRKKNRKDIQKESSIFDWFLKMTKPA